MSICLIDTSVFVEILDVPGRASEHEKYAKQTADKAANGESLLLPLATIIETGNHIGQIKKSGDDKIKACAELFVDQILKALNNESPFRAIDFLKQDDLSSWISEFPMEFALKKVGLGDVTIIKDYQNEVQKLKASKSQRRVYIWSKDKHLAGYDTQPPS